MFEDGNLTRVCDFQKKEDHEGCFGEAAREQADKADRQINEADK